MIQDETENEIQKAERLKFRNEEIEKIQHDIKIHKLVIKQKNQEIEQRKKDVYNLEQRLKSFII
jgi:hypothetical protein